MVRGPKPLTQSADAQAVIRVEQITVADAPGPGRIEMQLDDSLYLGDRWEYRLRRGSFNAKAHGTKQLAAGTVWAEIPTSSVWLFPQP